MTYLKTIAIAGLIVAPGLVIATPQMGRDFSAHYKIAKGSPLDKMGCSVCHIGRGPRLNPYGTDMAAAMKAASTKKVTPAVLNAVANLDSDKDGVNNAAEIAKGTNPGDANSK